MGDGGRDGRAKLFYKLSYFCTKYSDIFKQLQSLC